MRKTETEQIDNDDLNNDDLRVILLKSIQKIDPSSWKGAWVVYTWKHVYHTSAPLLLTLLKAVNSTINREHGGVVYRYGKRKGRSVYYVRKEEWKRYLQLLEFYLFKYDGSLSNTDFVNPLPL